MKNAPRGRVFHCLLAERVSVKGRVDAGDADARLGFRQLVRRTEARCVLKQQGPHEEDPEWQLRGFETRLRNASGAHELSSFGSVFLFELLRPRSGPAKTVAADATDHDLHNVLDELILA